MKRLHHIFLAFILVAASCTPHGAVEDGNKVIQATLPDYIESKVALTEKSETSGLALSWKQSDRLVVVGETSETYKPARVLGFIQSDIIIANAFYINMHWLFSYYTH